MGSRRLATTLSLALAAAVALGLPHGASAQPGAGSDQASQPVSAWPIADVMGSEQARWRIASTANREVKINAQMIIAVHNYLEDCPRCGPGGTDIKIERCNYAIFVQFPAVAGASSYNVVVQDKHPRVNVTRSFTGPPFNDNAEGYMTPAGAHWFGGLTGGAGPAPCPTDPYEGGRFEILRAVAVFDGKARIVGTVRKVDGSGAAGARVTARGTSSVSAKTAAGGGYSMKVKNGRYEVSAKGYCVVGPAGCKKSKTVRVKDGPQQVDFGPRPTVTLSGRVTEERCDLASCEEPVPLEGAAIVASSPDGDDPAQALTAPDGTWSVDVPSGRWKVAAAQEGRSFKPAVRRVTAGANVGGLDFESCQFRGEPLGASCDPDRIDWRMPERLTPEIAKRHFKDIGLPHLLFLDPPSWEAELFLTRKGEPVENECAARQGRRWRWIVKPRDPKTVVRGEVPDGCRTAATVSRLGDFDVTAVRERFTEGGWEEEARIGPDKVTLDDIIVAGVGDSSASGEGNPAFYFENCDRSATSYQFQAARYVEEQDPHTSVTFLHPACSGARLDHMWKRSFGGTRGNTRLPPQLEQIARRLDRKGLRREPEVDAVIAGVGVNDIAFGPVIGYCYQKLEIQPGSSAEGGFSTRPCPDQRVRAVHDGDGFVKEFRNDRKGSSLASVLDGLHKRLKPKYAAFIVRVRAGLDKGGLGLRKRERMLLTQYPNFSRDAAGVCDTRGRGDLLPWWSAATWAWMGDNGERLSAEIRQSSRLGYTAVPMDQTVFHPRGYCAPTGTSWFVGLKESLDNQGNINGAFHPNAAAHEVMAADTRAKLCQALYGDTQCTGDFRG